LPVFRFSKAFGIARDAKVFLNLEGGLTGGAVSDAERYKKQAERLKIARQKDRQLIEDQGANQGFKPRSAPYKRE
jgi:hypothetical protein